MTKKEEKKSIIEICNLKKGQKITIVGVSGSKEEPRTFTAVENLEVTSGMEHLESQWRRDSSNQRAYVYWR